MWIRLSFFEDSLYSQMFNVVFHCDFALDENTLWFGDLLSRGFFFNGSRSERLPQFLGLYELK